jgi:hypothetical protein
MSPRSVVRAAAMAALALGLSIPAAAQPVAASAAAESAPALAAAQHGPLVVQPVRSGPVFGTDVRVTDIDGDTGTFVGGYAGWLADERFLIGGAFYWLADHPSDLDMMYGGLVVGWQVPAGRAFRFGTRALVGAGDATVSRTYYFDVPVPPVWPRPHGGATWDGPWYGDTTVGRRYYFGETFFVFEPQVDATIRFGSHVGLNVGVGYRLIAGADDFNEDLQGVSGSIALQFGVF